MSSHLNYMAMWAANDILASALVEIRGSSCECYTTGIGSCVTNRPNGRYAYYGADKWCNACLADNALMEYADYINSREVENE